jgi:hypothetical protein
MEAEQTRITQGELAHAVADTDRNFAGLGGYQASLINNYRRKVESTTDSKLCEAAMKLMPELQKTLLEAAQKGRTSCEFVVGNYGLHGTFDRLGKKQLAKVAGFIISELNQPAPMLAYAETALGNAEMTTKFIVYLWIGAMLR